MPGNLPGIFNIFLLMFCFNDIEVIQLEISNYCNAACPQCPRNYFGGNTIPTLPLRKWSLSEFKKIFTTDLLNQLRQVYFCGTYGDPMTNGHIFDMCSFLKESNSNIKIGIHTNGGIGKNNIYKELAPVTDFIAFGIDGLEDTNSIYRRHVKWKKVIDNAKCYIDAGGHAIWDFIVFKHNEHQVDQAHQLSTQLGFREFNAKKTSRFLTRDHVYSDKLMVRDRSGFIDYTITLPSDEKYRNDNYKQIMFIKNTHGSIANYAQTTKITCNAQRIKEVYIGADGFVFPCGWLHDRLYGPEIESHADHLKIKKIMQAAGGWDKINVFQTTLKNIIDGVWFQEIQRSWTSQDRVERCGIMCGDTLNLIKSQNEEVKYKL